jgi:hypothetical protein
MPDDSTLHICPDCQDKVSDPAIHEMVEKTVDTFFQHLDKADTDLPTVLIAAAMISSAIADEIIGRAKEQDPEFDDQQAEDACGLYVEMVDGFLGDLINFPGEFADDDDDDGYDDEDAAAPPSMH